MDTEPVSSSESSTKNGAAAPTTNTETAVAATPEQLAKQAKEVVELAQEWTVCGRRTSAAILAYCAAEDIFEKNATFANNGAAIVKLETALGITADRAKDHRKQRRSIAAAHKALVTIQDALPPTFGSIYEVSLAFAPGKDLDKRYILEAVKNGVLNTRSSRDVIRNLRKDGPQAEQKEQRVAPTSIRDIPSKVMTDIEIVKQVKAQGVTAPHKQAELVKQIREAEAAIRQAEATEATETREPAVIDATPVIRVPLNPVGSEREPAAESERGPERTFRVEDIEFTNLVETDATISGHFTIHKRDGRWSQFTLAAALKEALNQAHT